ncbi:hypothetical protein FLM48_05255 [Shewanella sp. Scap07]|uniref:DUF6776 family protein n=1 Tax=Shewanella sp. Scap07 TaxID=2589987 RepID=UPI0015B7934D|nr:DUF6776 family protein [Shewanella sp. Scap07]QLE84548.1 hypothetical protein FLM48_05255 [Shewanella sp. Scap07]
MPNYHRWANRMQANERKIRPSSVYLLLLVMVAFLLGGLVWQTWQEYQAAQVEVDDSREVQLRGQLQQQAEVLAARNLALTLEQEANKNMQQLFAEQHNKQQQLERELAFYRSIMAPENNAEGVAIHGLELIPSQLDNKYRLKLILTQLQKRKQSLKGQAKLVFTGLQEGEVVNIPLTELSEQSFAFQFRYFQVLETEVILPAGFELNRVTVDVTVPATRWTKRAQTEQTFERDDILPIDLESIDVSHVDIGSGELAEDDELSKLVPVQSADPESAVTEEPQP